MADNYKQVLLYVSCRTNRDDAEERVRETVEALEGFADVTVEKGYQEGT